MRKNSDVFTTISIKRSDLDIFRSKKRHPRQADSEMFSDMVKSNDINKVLKTSKRRKKNIF